MELSFMNICGTIACALMLWWAIAIFHFTMKYDRDDRMKVSTSATMLVCALIIAIMDVAKVFGLLG